MKRRNSGNTILLVLLLGSITAQADESTMDTEIDFLLDTVVSSHCLFIRNGKEYSAPEAREHLQMKRKRGKRHYSDTEEFIEKIASKSSLSGKDYLIQCGEAPQQTANEWFSALLQKYREDKRESVPIENLSLLLPFFE